MVSAFKRAQVEFFDREDVLNVILNYKEET